MKSRTALLHKKQTPEGESKLSTNEAPIFDDSKLHDHERIAALAYARYELRGRQDGFALDDWLAAERQSKATASRGSR
jgi:hypothetical protein